LSPGAAGVPGSGIGGGRADLYQYEEMKHD